MTKSLCFLTGASGVGKTTLTHALAERINDPTVAFFYFDTIGIPTQEEMEAQWGSWSVWQKEKVLEWIDRLIHEEPYTHILLDGQSDLRFIQEGCARHNFTNYHTILIDCPEAEMERRLIEERKQPHLVHQDMRNWLHYLRRQAQEMGTPIINNGQQSVEESVRQILEIWGVE